MFEWLVYWLSQETEDLAANPNQALGLPGKVLDAALSIARFEPLHLHKSNV